jgi:amino acid transporter
MAEKQPEYAVDPTATDHHYNVEEASKIEARRGSKVNEASDLYGDIQTAEEYGYVSRG